MIFYMPNAQLYICICIDFYASLHKLFSALIWAIVTVTWHFASAESLHLVDALVFFPSSRTVLYNPFLLSASSQLRTNETRKKSASASEAAFHACAHVDNCRYRTVKNRSIIVNCAIISLSIQHKWTNHNLFVLLLPFGYGTGTYSRLATFFSSFLPFFRFFFLRFVLTLFAEYANLIASHMCVLCVMCFMHDDIRTCDMNNIWHGERKNDIYFCWE